MDPQPLPDQPDRLIQIQINVTVILRRHMWLLAGIAVGNSLPDGLLEKAAIILRACTRLVH